MVDSLKAAGLEAAMLSMGCLPSAIQQYFASQDLAGFSLEYVVEDYPLGTAGGLKNAEEHLDEGSFVAVNGDVLTGLDLAEVIEAHEGAGGLATIPLTSVEDPSVYGLVEVDYRLQVKRFVEKPGSDEVYTLINVYDALSSTPPRALTCYRHPLKGSQQEVEARENIEENHEEPQK